MSTLRPYQKTALEAASKATALSKGILICMPTGCGKTHVAVEACVRHVEKGGRPLFVAPRRELVEQARAALRARGLHLAWVRTIQELTQEGAQIPDFTMCILDEARHYVADSWSKLKDAKPDALYLGLDATPERGDGKGLGGMFDVLIEAISVKKAIQDGWLVQPQVLRPERALGPRELAQSPVDAYVEHAKGMSAVVFAPTVELAIQYTCELRDKSLSVATVWGDMPDKLRDACLEGYATGDIKILVNVNLLTEGWDSPRTEAVILARGFGTMGGYLQAVGRGLRPYQGKKRCLIIDLTGVSHTHGDPDEERTWHLEGRACRRAADDENIRFCPICGQPTSAAECESCGYSGAMRLRKPKVLGLPLDRFARKREESDFVRVQTLGRWIAQARAKGWKEGHAIHRFNAVYGSYPSPALVAQARNAARNSG